MIKPNANPSNPTDSDLRTKVLKALYDLRREPPVDIDQLKISGVETREVGRICDQLAEYGLIKWNPIRHRGYVLTGIAQITAGGTDVVEGKSDPPVSMSIDNRIFAFNQSSHNIIGDQNVQIGDVTINQILTQIEKSSVPPEKKEEARGVITRAFQHPAVTAVLAGVSDGIARAFKD